MTASEERARQGRHRGWLWATVGLLVVVAIGALVAVPRLRGSDQPRDHPIPDDLQGTSIDGAINVLLLGMDERSNNKTEPIRTDTIIIMHIPATHDAMYLISIPRDTQVAIPAFPETGFSGSARDKVNAAFAFGARQDGLPDPSPQGRARGANLTMQTLNRLVPGGLTFHGAAIINFTGFARVLKALGGVDMCIDVETRSIHFDKNNKYHTTEVPYDQRKIYTVGCRHLEYWEALDFARQRHFANGDYTRQRHGQQLLKAIFTKITARSTLPALQTIAELRAAAGDQLTLDLGGQPLQNWAYTLRAIDPDDITMIMTNGGKITPAPSDNSFELLSPDSMQLLVAVREDMVHDFLVAHPDWVISPD